MLITSWHRLPFPRYDIRGSCSSAQQASPALIGAEQDHGPDFLLLANALSALYPRGRQEKRLLDAMLLAVPK